jgi:carbon-monoxide dehydrogenase medium subunit
MKSFEYIRPSTLNEAAAALRDSDDARLLAGGTDLLVAMKTGTVRPKYVIDLKGIRAIDSIEYDDGFKLGALATIRDIEVSPLVREKLPVLSDAAATLGSVQIRNRATIGGNLCQASPAADMTAVLLAMDCRVTIASPAGERTIALDQFFVGPSQTVLGRDEILSGISIPKEAERFRGRYFKHGPRKAMDIGIVNIAVLVDADLNNGQCIQVRIAMGAVAPTVIRAQEAEALLQGSEVQPELIREAAAAASAEAKPISDFRASAGFRKELVRNLVTRGFQQLFESGNPSSS